ncbi:MAG: hypothetical protein WCK54_05505, partial [Desulfuromonadales bacterium]
IHVGAFHLIFNINRYLVDGDFCWNLHCYLVSGCFQRIDTRWLCKTALWKMYGIEVLLSAVSRGKQSLTIPYIL